MADATPPDDHELDAALTRILAESLGDDADLRRLVDLFDADDPGVEVTTGAIADRSGELVAVRSAGTVEDHQVVVRGGWVDVVLDAVPAGPGLVDVRGTVLDGDDVWSVQLLRLGDEAAITVTDELGEFALLGVPAGSYQLVIAGGRAELVTDLELS